MTSSKPGHANAPQAAPGPGLPPGLAHLQRGQLPGLMAAAWAASPQGIAICDRGEEILVANDALAAFLGLDDAVALSGRRLQDLLVREDRRTAAAASDRAFRHPTGEVVWGRLARTPFQDPTGTDFVLIQIDDVTASRAARARLEYDANHDHLTGLVNRRTLMEAAETALAGDAGPVALLLVDVDRFKTINDALGHPEGDRLLETIASRLRSTMRIDDVVCRLGGDEFAILLRSPVTENEAAASAERLLALMAQPVVLDGQPVASSVSIGISFSRAGSSLEQLLREADAALYKAKSAGRNRSAVFDDELRATVERRSRLEGELRLALAAGRLQLYYQPEVDMVTDAILGVEALVRWDHPVHGVMTADAFVGIAEDAGMAADLGRWVLTEACRQLAAWRDELSIAMRVNVSALQLSRPDLVGEVADALEQTGVASEQVCLEVTETALMADVERSAKVLEQLGALGLQIAVDDFGTGFSSLAYLKRFPVQILKIDRSFVDDVDSDSDSRAIVASVLGLADSLDLEVIAEGVETEEQRRALVELGCRRAQGFLFAESMDKAALTEWLRGRQVSG